MTHTRLLLVQPPIHEDSLATYSFLEPLSLEALAAGVLKHQELSGTEVEIVDLRVKNDLMKRLADFRPHFVGVTGITIDYPCVVDCVEKVKRFDERIVTIVGGHHATVSAEDFYLPTVDIIVCGPGIGALCNILLLGDKLGPLENVDNIVFKKNGQFIKTESNIDSFQLKSFPIPARHLTKNYQNKYRLDGLRYGLMVTSFGCPSKCSFCACWKALNGKYIQRSPEAIVEELKNIPQHHIFIGDDHTFANKKWAIRVAELIINQGITKSLEAYCRADTIVESPDLFARWKAAGLSALVVGFESTSDSDLSNYNKGKNSTAEINERANQILLELGIRNYAHILVRPDFSKKDFDNLKQYSRKLGIAYPIFPILTPLPGTLFREETPSVSPDRYQYYDLMHPLIPTKLPLDEFLEEYKKLYWASYSYSDWARGVLKQASNFLPWRKSISYPASETNWPNPIVSILIRYLWKKEFQVKLQRYIVEANEAWSKLP